MTEREALKLALECAERCESIDGMYSCTDTITAIKEALAQPDQLFEENERLHVENRRLIERIETIGVPVGVGGFVTTTTQPEQEPVANVVLREGSPTLLRESDIKPTDERLYTTPPQGIYYTPPQRTWVGLTDKEMREAMNSVSYSQLAMTHAEWAHEVQKATEARLKQKNGYAEEKNT